MADKLYEVVNIDFWDLIIEARECNLNVSDVPEEELFRLEDFGKFYVILHNERGKVVNFEEYVKRNGNV